MTTPEKDARPEDEQARPQSGSGYPGEPDLFGTTPLFPTEPEKPAGQLEPELEQELSADATNEDTTAEAELDYNTPPPLPVDMSGGNSPGGVYIIDSPPRGKRSPNDDAADSFTARLSTGVGRRMSLGDHLMELRARLIVCLVVLGGSFLFGLIFYQNLWEWIFWPQTHAEALLASYLPTDAPRHLIRIRQKGPLAPMLHIGSLALYFAILLSIPTLLYQLWAFVSPGLKKEERAALIPIFTFGSVMFFAGVAVAFFFALPLGLCFLVILGGTFKNAESFWDFENYLSFIMMGCLGFGLCFETPLVMMALTRFRIIKSKHILLYWRQAVITMVILGAVLTPPDPFTLAILSGIMITLYFGGYFLAKWVEPPDLL